MYSKQFVGFIVILVNIISFCYPIQNVPIRQIQPTCSIKEYFESLFQCDITDAKSSQKNFNFINKCHKFNFTNKQSPAIFIIYDVNAVEGFNLRRDVYIRMAVFLKKLRQKRHYENARLVLPPFYRLYHWNLVSSQRHTDKTKEIVFWNHFFDMNSLRLYTEIIDFWEYFEILQDCFGQKRNSKLKLDQLYQLRHFDSMFQSGKFEERFDVRDKCTQNVYHSQGQFNHLYNNLTFTREYCVEYQGTASMLHDLFQQQLKMSTEKNVYSVALLNAETVLHDHWGDVEYWRARRSMRFNSYLIETANAFRRDKLKSTDDEDLVKIPADWRDETEHRSAIGGNYLCAHLRRADFIRGREKTTPSLRSAAAQISNYLKQLNLTTAFIASDCTGKEFYDLKGYLRQYHVVKFTPSSDAEREKLKPGGIAIVDQIVCSYARFFIGTYESTFTYRIYEEREILSFPSSTTFNTFCKTPNDPDCPQNSVWQIVYENAWNGH